MIKYLLVITIMLCLLTGCDSKKISQLEKQLDSCRYQVNQKEAELSDTKQELEKNKQQLSETIEDLKTATTKNEQATIQIYELESKINNLTDELGKDSLIIPIYLIGKPVVIYTKPYEDIQILIGSILKIQHGNKVIFDVVPSHQEIEIPFNNIIGYRLVK